MNHEADHSNAGGAVTHFIEKCIDCKRLIAHSRSHDTNKPLRLICQGCLTRREEIKTSQTSEPIARKKYIAELEARIIRAETSCEALEQAIRTHRDAVGDDRRMDDQALYKVLPEGYEPPVDTIAQLTAAESRCDALTARCHALEGQLKAMVIDGGSLFVYTQPGDEARCTRCAKPLSPIYPHSCFPALSAPTPEAP